MVLEPNDKPIGKGLEAWERNWKKEQENLENLQKYLLYTIVQQNGKVIKKLLVISIITKCS